MSKKSSPKPSSLPNAAAPPPINAPSTIPNNTEAVITYHKTRFSKLKDLKKPTTILNPRSTEKPTTDIKSLKASSAHAIPPVDAKTTKLKPPNTAHVPKQTHISRELEVKLRKQALTEARLNKGRSFLRFVRTALLILAIPIGIVAYYQFAFSENEQPKRLENAVDAKVSSPATESKLKSLLKNGTTAELINYDDYILDDILTVALPQQLLAYQAKIQIADRVVELNESEETVAFAIVNKINSMISIVSLARNFDIDQPELRKDLSSYSEIHQNSSDPKIASHAQLGILVVTICKYLEDDSAINFDNLMQCIDELPLQTPSSINKQILVANSLIELSLPSKRVLELQLNLAKKLKTSIHAIHHDLGQQLYDESALRRPDFSLLRHMIPIHDEPSIINLKEIVLAIEEYPDVSWENYLNTIAMLESLREIHEYDLESNLSQKLLESSSRISEPESQARIADLLQKGQTRANLIGKQFELDGGSASEKRINRKARALVIAFVSCTTDSAVDQFSVLADYMEPDSDVQFLLAFSLSTILLGH